MKAILNSVLALTIIASVIVPPGKAHARTSKYIRPSFSFSTGEVITTLRKNTDGYYLPAQQPALVCVAQLRGIEIGNNNRRVGTTYVSKETEVSGLNHTHTDQHGGKTITVLETFDHTSGGNRKSCNIVGVVKDLTKSDSYGLLNQWVNIQTNVREDGYMNFTPLASSDSSPFMAVLGTLTLGLSDIFQETAQSIVNGIQYGINARIAQKNANTAAVYNGIATELMLMLCQVQAAQVAAQACPGSKIESVKYVQQFQLQYNNFVHGSTSQAKSKR